MERVPTPQEVLLYWIDSRKILEPDHDFWQWKHLKPGDTYVDGGAFLGRNAIYAAKLMKGSGRIVCVEAQPDVFELLEATLKVFGVGIATPVRRALGVVSGPVHFRTHHYGAGHVEPGGAEVVPGSRLEDLLEELKLSEVDLLSLDVETAERDVLLGAGKYLQEKRIRNLAIAGYHQTNPPSDARGELVRVIEGFGYRVLSLVDKKNEKDSVIYASAD